MYTLSEAVPVNRDRAAEDPELTTEQVWKGLLDKADNALPYVPHMTSCTVLETYPDGLLRDVVYRGEPARERITFTPGRRVQFVRTGGTTRGTILNELEDDDGNLVLRFTFSLEKEGLTPDSDEEREHFSLVEKDYRASVHATLAAIRRVAREASASSATG